VWRPAEGFGIRLDGGNAYPGARVLAHYDSMLMKVTASALSFNQAADKLTRALLETRIRGVSLSPALPPLRPCRLSAPSSSPRRLAGWAVATTPPTGLNPHWIRYPGGMVHVGVKTNIPFILNVLKHPDFVSGHATTSFIGDNPQLLDFTDARDRGQKQYLESSSPRVKAQLLEMQINLLGCSTTLAR